MEPVEIIRDGLLLRPWRVEDADAVYRACQDPDIQRWTSVPRPYEKHHAQAFVGDLAPRSWAHETAAHLGVFDATTDHLLGSCGLVELNLATRTGEIGYWTAPWARGRGVAERAVRAVAGWGLDVLGLQRIAWRAEVGNHPSRLVALRAGFCMEGILRAGIEHRDGHLVDGWIGSLLPGDPREEASLDPVVVRQAKIFAGHQPVLTATVPGGGITLRRPTEGDIDAIIAGARDAESVRWTSVPDPYEREHAEFMVHRHAPRQWARAEGAAFSIADADDAHVGLIELRISPGDPTIADVGFVVGPAGRGQGYAPAALRALSGWGFDALGLNRIEWRAHVGNEASKRVAEKAGFTVEGVQRAGCPHRGGRRDAWIGALLADDVKEGEC